MDTIPHGQALALLQRNFVGTLATLSHDGSPRVRTVYYVTNAAFEIFIFTLADTRKVLDINNDHRAAFVVSDVKVPLTLQIEGVLVELPDTTINDLQVKELMDTFMKMGTHFAPLTHLDAAAIIFYKLVPSWIRFGDFTKEGGTDDAFTQIIPSSTLIS